MGLYDDFTNFFLRVCVFAIHMWSIYVHDIYIIYRHDMYKLAISANFRRSVYRVCDRKDKKLVSWVRFPYYLWQRSFLVLNQQCLALNAFFFLFSYFFFLLFIGTEGCAIFFYLVFLFWQVFLLSWKII